MSISIFNFGKKKTENACVFRLIFFHFMHNNEPEESHIHNLKQTHKCVYILLVMIISNIICSFAATHTIYIFPYKTFFTKKKIFNSYIMHVCMCNLMLLRNKEAKKTYNA